jgi:hypothetical protein
LISLYLTELDISGFSASFPPRHRNVRTAMMRGPKDQAPRGALSGPRSLTTLGTSSEQSFIATAFLRFRCVKNPGQASWMAAARTRPATHSTERWSPFPCGRRGGTFYTKVSADLLRYCQLRSTRVLPPASKVASFERWWIEASVQALSTCAYDDEPMSRIGYVSLWQFSN